MSKPNQPSEDMGATPGTDPSNTLPHQAQGAVPRMPHERDESSDSQPADRTADNSTGDQAHADATGGGQDTGRAPVMDEVYNEKVRTGSTPMRD